MHLCLCLCLYQYRIPTQRTTHKCQKAKTVFQIASQSSFHFENLHQTPLICVRMPNYKSKFNENWMKQFPWVRAVDDDIYKAQCKWCECEFKVDVRGIGAVKQHRDTAKHKAKESESNHGSAGMQKSH